VTVRATIGNGRLTGTNYTQDFSITVNPVAVTDIVITATAGTGGTVTGSGTYPTNTSVMLTATPNASFTFDGWFENNNRISTNAAFSFTATANRTLEARFIQQQESPVITTTALPNGTVGTAYNQAIVATGTAPIAWSVTTGSLPNGLFLNSNTATITGTPIAAGTFNFTVRAQNASGNVTRQLSITITAEDQFTITATAGHGGTVLGGGSYPINTSLTLQATPSTGFIFDGWFENNERVSSLEAWSIQIISNRTLQARFVAIIQPNEPATSNEHLYIGANTWAREDIQAANEAGMIPADLLGNFQNPITRENFCRLAIAYIEYHTGMSIADYLTMRGLAPRRPFFDSGRSEILAAAALGIVQGTDLDRNLFSPNQTLTRADGAVMLANLCRVLGVDTERSPQTIYNDQSDIRSWARTAVNFVTAMEIMGNTSSVASVRNFSPNRAGYRDV
jgi:hypothetical protein